MVVTRNPLGVNEYSNSLKKDAQRMKHPKNLDENLEEYDLFYLEIPKTDYMDDIEIQDEYDKPEEEQAQTASESSDYTRASLEAEQQQESDDETAG
jgi:hypothetical protein